MWTTGIIGGSVQERIVLYLTGKKYAGENLDDILQKRHSDLEPMIVMSDALANNHPRRHEVYQVLCNVHSRRGFKDLTDKYKAESEHVLGIIAKVYLNEKITREMALSAEERMLYHAEHSESLMNELEEWCRKQFKEKLVEPNSSLGKGISYILKHWVELTHFYRTPGIPLDNNVLEEKLRLQVLNRKNFLFYRSTLGALVGDIMTSTLKTCEVNKVNPFDYLTFIQDNAIAVRKNPKAYLPWNYHQSVPTTSLQPEVQ
jgi:hypothetical protein